MAYWLICQSCKEWSKSNTPLSNDKLCPNCNKPFVSEKPNIIINSVPEIRTVNESQPGQNPPPTTEAITLPEQEVKETKEAQPTTDLLETPKINDISAAPDEPQAEDTPEAIDNSEVNNQPEIEEITETPENIPTEEQSDKPETSQTIESQENKTQTKQVPFMQRKKKDRRPG